MINCFRLSLLILLYTITGCTANKKEISGALDGFRFDQKVIDKLPLYDSMAALILRQLPVFYQTIDSTDGYQAFRYVPGYNETGMFNKLPQETKLQLNDYFSRIGKDFIYGIDVFKDTTIKIHVRISEGTKALVMLDESLSYMPDGRTHRQRKFPDKDTILSSHWQYWVRVDEQEFFQ